MTQSPAWHRRQRIWRHNAMVGHTFMIRAQLNNMISAETTTEETKHYARTILGLVTHLQNSLTVLKDPAK